MVARLAAIAWVHSFCRCTRAVLFLSRAAFLVLQQCIVGANYTAHIFERQVTIHGLKGTIQDKVKQVAVTTPRCHTLDSARAHGIANCLVIRLTALNVKSGCPDLPFRALRIGG